MWVNPGKSYWSGSAADVRGYVLAAPLLLEVTYWPPHYSWRKCTDHSPFYLASFLAPVAFLILNNNSINLRTTLTAEQLDRVESGIFDGVVTNSEYLPTAHDLVAGAEPSKAQQTAQLLFLHEHRPS